MYSPPCIFALLFTAVGFVPAAVSCGGTDGSGDKGGNHEPTVAFRVIEGGGRVQVVTREEELPLGKAESEAEELVGFEIALPASLPKSLAPVQVEVWQNPSAPLLLLQRGVRVMYSEETKPAEIVVRLEVGHPREGPLQPDDQETVDVPGIGPVLVGPNQQRMANGAYMWLMDDVRYRLVYLEGADEALRGAVLRAIQELRASE